MSDSSDPIILVGAGIGGLFAGLCLQRKNIDFLLLEKAEELTEVGAGIQIGANGSRLIHQLGLENEVRKYATAPSHGLMMNGLTGRKVCSYPLSDYAEKHYQFPHYQIRRADLQRVLVEALELRAPGCLRLSQELSQIDQSSEAVQAVTVEGEVFHGRALVGCDGIHSGTRQLLFGNADPLYSGCAAWRALVPTAEMASSDLIPKIWIGDGRHLVQYPVESGRSINLVACVETELVLEERWHGRSSKEDLVDSFSGWCPEVKRILSAAEDALMWGLFERPVLDSWRVGHATLLGDAAHAMLPSLAQGAVMAMEDAEQLAHSLATQENTSKALDHYQMRRIGRNRKVQAVARKNMNFFHQSGSSDRLSMNALQLAGSGAEAIIGSRYNWLYGYSGV